MSERRRGRDAGKEGDGDTRGKRGPSGRSAHAHRPARVRAQARGQAQVCAQAGARAPRGRGPGQGGRRREAGERRRETRKAESEGRGEAGGARARLTPAAETPLPPPRPAVIEGEEGATAGKTDRAEPTVWGRGRATKGTEGTTEPELEKREGRVCRLPRGDALPGRGQWPRPGARGAAGTGGLMGPGAGRT